MHTLILFIKFQDIRNQRAKEIRKKIKKIMEEYEYDSDYIENVSNDFCEGFNAAKDIIAKMLSDKYWEQTKGWENGSC